jgi:hypothetical protein
MLLKQILKIAQTGTSLCWGECRYHGISKEKSSNIHRKRENNNRHGDLSAFSEKPQEIQSRIGQLGRECNSLSRCNSSIPMGTAGQGD